MHSHQNPNDSCGHGARSHHGDSGQRGFKPPCGPSGHPHRPAGRGGQRARRGDVRAAVLRLLSEQPMHGYQMIQELSERSSGAWNPSAGSVYPTLQMLADEGLIVAEETAGKKVYSLTEAGTAAVAGIASQPAPWDEAAQSNVGGSGYHQATGRLMQAVFQIGKSGSANQLTAAVEVMNDARKKLYAILAED